MEKENVKSVIPPEKERFEKVNKVIEMVDQSEISSIQSVVSGVIDIINDPQSSAKDLKDIIELDPPLTAKVLKVANSAYYYHPRKISEIQYAVIWIGFDMLTEIALSQKVWEVFDQSESIGGYSRSLLWKHSVAVAILGKMIYRREFGEKGDNAYAAGLLHDIGIIVEHQFLENDFRIILDKAEKGRGNLSKVEYEVLGYTHADIGKGLTEHWSFPEELVVAIGNHHNPDKVSQDFLRLASTLYVADYLCQEKGIGYSDAPVPDSAIFRKCLRKLKIKDYALDLIVNDMEQEIAVIEGQGLFEYGKK